MIAHQVSTDVNNVANEHADLIVPMNSA